MIAAPPPVRLPAQIWLGDAVRVCGSLRVDSTTAEQVLELLGLGETSAEPVEGLPVATATPVPGRPRPGVASVPPARPPERARPPTARAVAERDRLSEPDADLSAVPLPPTAEVARVDRHPPRRLPTLAEVLQPPPQDIVLEPVDLLDPGRQRAVLTPLCSEAAPTGQPDLEAMVERLARRQPLVDIPREVAVTTRRGVQLLLDHGPAMVPFWRDQQAMERTLRLIAGPDGFEVLHFAGTPLDPPGAGNGPQWMWSSYRPPLSAIPVLALTDLATGPETDKGQSVDRWLRFAALVRGAGCPLVALVPAPLVRVAPPLRRAMSVVSWDRGTGVRDTVVAARRAAGRIPGRPRGSA